MAQGASNYLKLIKPISLLSLTETPLMNAAAQQYLSKPSTSISQPISAKFDYHSLISPSGPLKEGDSHGTQSLDNFRIASSSTSMPKPGPESTLM